MNFFEIVPTNFFNPLYSSNLNKNFYIESLLVLWREYIHANGLIKKGACVEVLVAHFATEFYALKEDNNKGFTENNIDGRAKYLLERLIETGWLQIEDTLDFEDVNIIIPEYSRKFLSVIAEVEEDEVKIKRFASNIYANLRIANEEREAMYLHFSNALSESSNLQSTLISMGNDIRKSYEALLQSTQVKEILNEFNKYIDRIAEKYHSLKTDENFYRYKANIMQILSDWEYDDKAINLLAQQANQRLKLEEIDEAKNEILYQISQMKELFTKIDKASNEIDKKHTQYVATTLEKVQYSLNQNRDFKGNLIKLISMISNARNKVHCLKLVGEKLPISHLESFTSGSLRKVRKKRDVFNPTPITIDIEKKRQGKISDEDISREYKSKKIALFSKQNILAFLKEKLNNRSQFTTMEMDIKSDDEFTKLVLAYKLIMQDDIPYVIQKGVGNVQINKRYSVPNMIIRNKEAK